MSNALSIALIGLGVIVIYAGSTGRLNDVKNSITGGKGGEVIEGSYIDFYRPGRSYAATTGVLQLSDQGQY